MPGIFLSPQVLPIRLTGCARGIATADPEAAPRRWCACGSTVLRKRIAPGFLQETPVLVMDEPTPILDFGNQALVLREMARIVSGGRTVIHPTHDPDRAFAAGTGVAPLHEGWLRAAGSPADALTEAVLSPVHGDGVRVECPVSGRTVRVPSLALQNGP